jgi:DNA polymerase-3 subunit epsilon
VIGKLYQYLSDRPGGAESEELLEIVFGARGDRAFGREFLSALLADDPRFIADAELAQWRLADKHLLDEPLCDAPFVVVDLETTGQHPDDAGITEIGAVRICGGREVDRYETLVNPRRPIPPYVATLTGITDAMVASAPVIEDVIPAFVRFAAGAVVVAHNAAFDVAVLDRASRRVLGRPLGLPSLCTFKLARQLLPEVARASLDGLAAHFALAKAARHRALADAELTAAVLLRLMQSLEGNGGRTVNALLDAQEQAGTPRRLDIRVPRHRFEALPEAPGVFWLLDEHGQALLVGQAENLRARVIAYVSGRAHLSDRQFDMLSATADVDFRPAANALERALIEAEEIQTRGPLFNRTDKHLPRGAFVKIQRKGRFPRVLVASRIAGDGALYVGPIKSRTLADDAVSLIAKTFRLRTCAGGLRPAPAVEPCWLGPASWCSSPCNAAVSAATYRAQVEEAALALQRDPSVLRGNSVGLRSDEKPETRSRDGAVVGRLLKLHRKRHWLVNAQSYVAAFPATEGGLWIAIVVAGFCHRLRTVTTVEDLEAALRVDADLDPFRRVTHFEADATTIFAHWIRRVLPDEHIVAIDIEPEDLEASFASVAAELAPLLNER